MKSCARVRLVAATKFLRRRYIHCSVIPKLFLLLSTRFGYLHYTPVHSTCICSEKSFCSVPSLPSSSTYSPLSLLHPFFPFSSLLTLILAISSPTCIFPSFCFTLLFPQPFFTLLLSPSTSLPLALSLSHSPSAGAGQSASHGVSISAHCRLHASTPTYLKGSMAYTLCYVIL